MIRVLDFDSREIIVGSLVIFPENGILRRGSLIKFTGKTKIIAHIYDWKRKRIKKLHTSKRSTTDACIKNGEKYFITDRLFVDDVSGKKNSNV